ncbi:RNase H family protein [Neorhizobium huautlense]|uniref:RNase H family protein n=1 Tax=Neorhizobium huautlense TaxID=67774 RepID=UPI003593EB74
MLQIYSDGSFNAASRIGGWAFIVFEDGDQLHETNGCQPGMDNNRFELLAVTKAMKWIEENAKGREVWLWTDSFHVVEGCYRWRKNLEKQRVAPDNSQRACKAKEHSKRSPVARTRRASHASCEC